MDQTVCQVCGSGKDALDKRFNDWDGYGVAEAFVALGNADPLRPSIGIALEAFAFGWRKAPDGMAIEYRSPCARRVAQIPDGSNTTSTRLRNLLVR